MIVPKPAYMPCLLALLFAMACRPDPASAQAIYIDEDFSDWESVTPSVERDESTPGYFRRLWITNDDDYIFFSIEVNGETILQQSTATLYIDTDNNPETGTSIADMGADLTWHFGLRSGTFIANGNQTSIGHHAIGVVNAPTVSGFRFEMAINRNARPDGQNPLFPSDEIRLILVDASSGDSIPGEGTSVSYTFQDIQRGRLPVNLSRHERAHLRVSAYNVERDQLFSPQHEDAFRRILRAIEPDLVGLTEIYNNSAQTTAEVMQAFIPQETGWHASKVGRDIVLASRFPIVESYGIVHNPARFDSIRTGAFLVDLRPMLDSDLLVFVSHPSCCNNTAFRQEQLDAMMAFLRDHRDSLEPDTPFMLIGDMNLVTYERQRRTLLNGEIIGPGFGPPFHPDWDGSSLADLKPSVTGLPMTFTWYDAPNSFSPGRLDYIIYSDYSLESLSGFTLFSPALTDGELEEYGLLADDTVTASDHLPLVGDFRLRHVVASSTDPVEVPVSTGIRIVSIYPNPVRTSAAISVTVPQPSTLTLTMVNLLGQTVSTLEFHAAYAGESIRMSLDISGLAPGVYFLRAASGGDFDTRKVMVVR